MPRNETVIELQMDESDGVFKPSTIHQKIPKVKKKQVSKRKHELQPASNIQSPQALQFIEGMHLALDVVERFRKVFR